MTSITSGCGEMAVSTHQDMGLGPVATEVRQETGQDHRVLCAGRPRARAEGRHDQRMGGPFKMLTLPDSMSKEKAERAANASLWHPCSAQGGGSPHGRCAANS